MNKLFKFLLSMVLVIACGKVFAEELTITYSEWSTDFPNGIPEVFVESETRYHFYKIVNGEVEYNNEYYTNLDGYIKDEGSGRPFYRYITNTCLVFDANNNMVTDLSYCDKSFCYTVCRREPNMINTSGKEQGNYDSGALPTVEREAVPYTGDNVLYYIVGLVLSISTIGIVLLVKRNKNKQIIRA